MRRASSLTNPRGSRSVGKLTSGVSSRPMRSVRARSVRVARTSTAAAQRPRESKCSSVGLRPREASPAAPSRTMPWAMSSLTIRPTALRCMPITRARAAREMGWWARSRLRTICRLMAREVLRVAIRRSFV